MVMILQPVLFVKVLIGPADEEIRAHSKANHNIMVYRQAMQEFCVHDVNTATKEIRSTETCLAISTSNL